MVASLADKVLGVLESIIINYKNIKLKKKIKREIEKETSDGKLRLTILSTEMLMTAASLCPVMALPVSVWQGINSRPVINVEWTFSTCLTR